MKHPAVFTTILGLLLAATFPAPAATRTWDGGGADNLWTTAANWDAAVVAGDNLVFPGTAPADSLLNTNNFPANTTFGSITLTGTNYNLLLLGNAIILTNGISHQSGGVNTVGLQILLGADQTFENTVAAGSLNLLGNVLDLNGRNLTNIATGLITLSRPVSGSGNLIKRGAGTLRVAGSAANDYAGSMTVEDGPLELNKTAGVDAVPGTLTIGDGTGAIDSAIVRLLAANQINNSSAVTIEDDGLLDLNGLSDAIGSLTVAGGDVAAGGGTLTLGGDVTANASTNTATISGNLSLGSATRIFSVAPGTAAPDLTISAVMSGSAGAGFTKTGAGVLRLSGTNTYSGLTTVNVGFLDVVSPSALGSASGGTVLSGGAILLLNGVTVAGETLTNASMNTALRISGTGGWSGNVVLDATLLMQFPGSPGTKDLSGAISGAGGLIMNDGGTLILSGTNHNTYAGTTTVSEGTLLLNKSAGTNAISGPLIIGDGVGGIPTAVVRLLAANQIGDASPVTIEREGLLDLNGSSDTLNSLTLTGGAATTGAGTLTLGGNVTANATNIIAAISGNLSLGSATRTFSIGNGTQSPDLTISAVISGGVGLTKTGAGTLQLGGMNTYSGVTTVNSGLLDVTNSFALGSTSSGTVLSGTGSLLIQGLTVAGEALTNDSSSTTLQTSVAAGWSGNVVLNSTLVLQVNSGTNNLSGAISGPGGLTKNGTGTLLFSGANDNTYAGTTTVTQGTLLLNKSAGITAVSGPLVVGNGGGGVNADVVRLQANSQISDSSPVEITSSGLLDADGFPEIVGPLSGTGNLQLDASAFSVSVPSDTAAFDGAISGTTSLTKLGGGAWALNGSNTYSGSAIVSAGTLLVNGTLPASSIGVSGMGTLGGTGTVGRVTMSGLGTISPGLSPGRLTTSNLTFIVTSKYRVELNGTNAGSGYDQLKVNGTVNNLASATLNASLGFASAISNVFTIIDNDGSEAVTNTFFGLAEGATVNVSGTPFRISYVGGSGNDVVLTQLTATQYPLLNIRSSATTNVVLSWATNFTGYTLEANTNLNTNLWAVVTNVPAASGTNNFVTNNAGGLQKSYRLRAP